MQNKQGRANPIKKIFICLINWGQSIFRPKICGILFYILFSYLFLFFQYYYFFAACHVIRMQASNRSRMNLFLHLLFLICRYAKNKRRRKKETTFLNWLYWYNNLFIQGWFRSTFVPIYSHSIYGYWCVSEYNFIFIFKLPSCAWKSVLHRKLNEAEWMNGA